LNLQPVDLDLDLRPKDLDLDLRPKDLDLTISESEDLALDLKEEDSNLDLDLPPWDLTTSLINTRTTSYYMEINGLSNNACRNGRKQLARAWSSV